jgi:hypothetical protein
MDRDDRGHDSWLNAETHIAAQRLDHIFIPPLDLISKIIENKDESNEEDKKETEWDQPG